MARFLAVAFLAWAALGWFAAPFASAQTTVNPARTSPVVVELYTSQGCLHCTRANRLLGTLSGEEHVLALTFSVDYWDYLGWHDTFAERNFAERQRAYSNTLHGRRSTPQLVINGMRQVSATDWDASRAALQAVQAMPGPPNAPTVSIRRLADNSVRAVVGSGTTAVVADVWLISFEPGPIGVHVLSGENANRMVWHYNLVRTITRAGSWTGAPAYYEQLRCSPECAVIVQTPGGGPILGAAVTRRTRR